MSDRSSCMDPCETPVLLPSGKSHRGSCKDREGGSEGARCLWTHPNASEAEESTQSPVDSRSKTCPDSVGTENAPFCFAFAIHLLIAYVSRTNDEGVARCRGGENDETVGRVQWKRPGTESKNRNGDAQGPPAHRTGIPERKRGREPRAPHPIPSHPSYSLEISQAPNEKRRKGNRKKRKNNRVRSQREILAQTMIE